jgi:rRNA maturation RNase YbeY
MPDSPDDTAANLILALVVEPPDLSISQLFGLGDEQVLDVMVRALARLGIAEPVEISVLLTSDARLRDLNREYRGQDKATDVLSFPAQTTPLVSAPADQIWQRPQGEPSPSEAGANGATPHEPGELVDLLEEDDLEELDELDEMEELDDELDLDDLEELDDGEVLDDELDELEDLEAEALDLGDIALSHEAVQRQAAAAGHSAAWECAYLLVHGVLHLAGYDDQTEAGYAAMTALQESILAATNIAK